MRRVSAWRQCHGERIPTTRNKIGNISFVDGGLLYKMVLESIDYLCGQSDSCDHNSSTRRVQVFAAHLFHRYTKVVVLLDGNIPREQRTASCVLHCYNIQDKPGVGSVVRVAACDPRVLSSSPIGH